MCGICECAVWDCWCWNLELSCVYIFELVNQEFVTFEFGIVVLEFGVWGFRILEFVDFE